MKSQVVMGARISGCLCSLIWKNKYLSPEGKVRIYKTCVRPVITYGAESRADTTLAKQLLRTTEMRIIRTIRGKTIRDKILVTPLAVSINRNMFSMILII